MNSSQIQQRISRMYDTYADQYESAEGHGILTSTEKEAWSVDIRAAADLQAGHKVLEVGAGTGVFSRLLAEWGCHVVGLDSSEAMLTEAHKRLPPLMARQIDFRSGDTHQQNLFEPQTFDWIVSRYLVNHLHDPWLVFQNWKHWLRANGRVLIIEGLWPRSDWGDDDLVDTLPLSCLQTRATVAYLLEKAALTIQSNVWLERVNAYFATQGNSVSRFYMVIAQKIT